MGKNNNLLINSQSLKLWDNVAGTYSETIQASETKLGQDIEKLLLGLGIEPGASLLEVGCGSGHLSGYLANRGYQTTLVDFSLAALEKAKRHYEQNNLIGNFIHVDMFDLSVDLVEPHDVVWNSGVLEHFDAWNAIDALKRMGQVARKYVIVLVPNASSVPYLLFRRQAMEKGKWIWGRELLRDSMKHLAEAAGLEVIEEQYLGMHFSYDQLVYVNSELGARYQNDDQHFLPREQNYLIALLACPKDREASVNSQKVIEDVLKKESKIETDTYYFDFSSLNSYLGKKDAKIDELQNLAASFKSQLEDKDNKIHELQDTNAHFESQLENKDNKIQELQEISAHFESQLEDKDNKIHELHGTNAYLKSQFEGEVADLKLKLETKNEKVANLRKNYLNIINESAKSASKITELESKLVEKNGEINNLSNNLKTYQIYTHSLKVEVERIHSLRSWKIITFIGNKYDKIKSVPKNLQKTSISFFGKVLPQNLKRKITRIVGGNYYVENIAVSQNDFDFKNSEFIPLPIEAGTVNILTPTFFNYSGNDMFFGGAERYLIELVRLIRKKGYKVNVYQNGTSDWIRFYNDIKVIGLNSGGNSQTLNNKFHTEIPPGELTIYLAFYLSYPYCHINSIGISHGVYWDNESMQRNAIINKNDNDINTALGAIRNCNKIISVDTNTINWVRAIDYGESEKFTYIPNFVDLNQFHPENSSDNRDKIVILYPRRLCTVRGFWLVESIVPDILKKYPKTEFHFVGKGDEEEIQRVSELVKKYPNRVKWYNLQPEEMQDAYHSADISLIPTINSEGTSLSCLEAMACGNAVIATNVGGLPNLILDGYNGYLIEPNANDLKETIKLLIKDSNLRNYVKKNAVEVVKKFDKEKWISKWDKILSENLHSVDQEFVTENEKDFNIVHVSTSFIKWSVMQQRPHQLCKEFVNKKIHTFFVVQDDENEKKCSSNYLQILTTKDDLYLERPVLYIYYPPNYEQINNFKNPIVIYDILDDISIHKESDLANKLPENKTAVHYHEKLLSEADIVTTTATDLYNKYKNIRNDIILVPNGVNYYDFCKEEYHLPSDFPTKNKTVIGYYGAIANWVDYKLLEYAAKSRPDYNFVYIGPISDERWSKVSKYKNIFYLGTKKYEELADYLHYFDVATVPFEINDVTKATSPVKIFEYMAGKKPIVTTDLPECRKYESILVSKNHEEFVKNLDLALNLKDDKKYLELLEKEAKENTWDKRAEIIINAIKEKL